MENSGGTKAADKQNLKNNQHIIKWIEMISPRAPTK